MLKHPIHPGDRFGRLAVTRFEGYAGTVRLFLCACDCGGQVVARANNLVHGKTRSCGCLRKETTSRTRSTHGGSNKGNRLYRIWSAMKNRCQNPGNTDYRNYGGRGIRVCAEWSSFASFRDWALTHGYGDDLSIERVDANGNYEPSNCTWIPMPEQSRNRRVTHRIAYLGSVRTIAEWADLLGMRPSTLYERLLTYHWPVERAMQTPVRQRGV